jgi:hypothetical protein
LIGRYVAPYSIGIAPSLRIQSGQNYGRTISVNFPGDGAQTVRVEPITTNRYPTVSIFDLRFDKSFSFGKAGRVTGMVDMFNLFNSSAPTALRLTTAGGTVSGIAYPSLYREVTELLAPRIIRFGIRYNF